MASVYNEVSSSVNGDYFQREFISSPVFDPVTGVASLTIGGVLDSVGDRDYFDVSTAGLIPASGRTLDDYVVWIRSTGSASPFGAVGLRSAKTWLGVVPSRIVGRTRPSISGEYWSLSKSNPDFVVDVNFDRWSSVPLGPYTVQLLFGLKDFVALDSVNSSGSGAGGSPSNVGLTCDTAPVSSGFSEAEAIYYEFGDPLEAWNVFEFDSKVTAADIAEQWFGVATQLVKQDVDVVDAKWLDIAASSWSGKVRINRVARSSDGGDDLVGKPRDVGLDDVVGSVLVGGIGSDRLQGFSGWDVAEGGQGNDLIRTGNGRDILSGGSGSDELWGGFGWNTYRSEKDGSEDLLVIKSDQWQVNSLNGKAGNNPDGCKSDIIEGLDLIDQIVIQGVNASDLKFVANVKSQGVTGIGIYAKDALEALYIGGDLTLSQLTAMTTGDVSGPAGGTYWSW